MDGNKVAHINLYADIKKHLDGAGGAALEDCPHCQDPAAVQTRDCMQREAVQRSVAALKSLAQSGTGAARGRIILPCGTGKSRIALRLIESLTEPGQVSAILCPSIALVAQLRREFLIHSKQTACGARRMLRPNRRSRQRPVQGPDGGLKPSQRPRREGPRDHGPRRDCRLDGSFARRPHGRDLRDLPIESQDRRRVDVE